MATKPGGCFFRLGYFMYTKTRFGYYHHLRELSKAHSKYENGHSTAHPTVFNGLQIVPIPILNDNYAYIVIDTHSNTAICVDPADPGVVQAALENSNAHPVAILTTHKHWDHCGGNKVMRQIYRDIRVYGGADDNPDSVTHPVTDGDILEFGPMKFSVIYTPGHTLGHVVYVLNGAPFGAPDSLFSGDHIFLAGAGRMFECAPSVMLRSLDNIRNLKDDTLVWPGHEYAADNLEFAQYLEPDNIDLKDKYLHVKEQRSNKTCTAPSTLGEEKKYNPFLRTSAVTMLEALGIDSKQFTADDTTRAMALHQIRTRKDNFKYRL